MAGMGGRPAPPCVLDARGGTAASWLRDTVMSPTTAAAVVSCAAVANEGAVA